MWYVRVACGGLLLSGGWWLEAGAMLSGQMDLEAAPAAWRVLNLACR